MENLDQIIVQDVVFTGKDGLILIGLAVIGAAVIIGGSTAGIYTLGKKVKNFISNRKSEEVEIVEEG